nr:TIGR03757 family integrating conjugative element protein [Alteromonas macleodii]
MYLSKHVLFVLALASSSAVASTQPKGGFSDTWPKKIEVFYDYSAGNVSEVEMAGIELVYYQLDKPAGLQGEISKKLPTNLDDAAAFMSQYANSEEGKKQIQAIVDGYQGVGRAYGLGVNKLPATVIDERYVVYGTTDVNQALRIYQKQGGTHE